MANSVFGADYIIKVKFIALLNDNSDDKGFSEVKQGCGSRDEAVINTYVPLLLPQVMNDYVSTRLNSDSKIGRM